MANILTADEAARVVMTDPTDERLLDLLPQVDAYVQQATGWNWAADATISPVAKSAARLQLALMYDLGAMQPSQLNILRSALICSLTQLEAISTGLLTVQSVNATLYVEDMGTYLASGALGLNLIDFNRQRSTEQRSVAQAVLDARPSNGYADQAAIQAALDAAIKAVLP